MKDMRSMITGDDSEIRTGTPYRSVWKTFTDGTELLTAVTLTPSEITRPAPMLPWQEELSSATGLKYPDIWPGQNTVARDSSMIKDALQ
jgi:hypothetical protein